MKILLTDGGHMNTLGILRQLKGHTIDILHHKRSAPAYSRYCHKLIKCPKITEERFYTYFLLEHLTKIKYDILIPVGAYGNYICSKYQTSIRRYTRLEIADFESFQIAIDKRKTFKFAEENNILHPKTYRCETYFDFVNTEIKYPVIIKSAGELIGKYPVQYIDNWPDLWYNLLKADYKTSELVIQERIIGEPYGFFCLYEHGICKMSICQRRIREYPPTGGHATSSETIYDDELEQIGKNIFDKLNWHGVGMAEFKKTNKGEYYLIELNPKFWTALELHIIAGTHFPRTLLDWLPDVGYKLMSFVWLFAPEGELYRLWYTPKDLFKVIKDIFRSKTDLHLDDPLPTIIQTLYWIVWILKKASNNIFLLVIGFIIFCALFIWVFSNLILKFI